jgi:hypothetical protein
VLGECKPVVRGTVVVFGAGGCRPMVVWEALIRRRVIVFARETGRVMPRTRVVGQDRRRHEVASGPQLQPVDSVGRLLDGRPASGSVGLSQKCAQAQHRASIDQLVHDAHAVTLLQRNVGSNVEQADSPGDARSFSLSGLHCVHLDYVHYPDLIRQSCSWTPLKARTAYVAARPILAMPPPESFANATWRAYSGCRASRGRVGALLPGI